MSHTKDFSILKWLVFPSLTLALAGVIAYFNVRVFGLEDGAPYIIVVGVLTGFSIAINKYIGSENVALARAAFILEISLALALAINAAYSFSVQRDMSVARQSEQTRSDDLKTISSLKSRTAQRDATRMIASNSGEVKSAQQIFADNERPLFWIMIAELLAYIVSAFTLLGISHLWTPKQRKRQIIQSTYSPDEDFDGVPDHRQRSSEFPSELEEKQVMLITPDYDSSTTVGRLSDFDRKRALQILRDHLRELAPKGNWFKADLLAPSGVSIRQYEWDRGNEQTIASTKQSNKLLRAVEREDFRARLRDELARCGFRLRKTR